MPQLVDEANLNHVRTIRVSRSLNNKRAYHAIAHLI